jgi:acetyl esterase/lipase
MHDLHLERAQDGDVLLTTLVCGTGGARSLSLHLLRPHPAPAAPLPAIVGIHGGAFMHGNKEAWLARLLPLVRRGYACASIEYRLSGEAIWPAQIEDCKCAVRFLRAHAAALGIDPARIGAWGSSAGGHLAALLGLAADAPALEGQGGWPEHSSAVQAVCDWFGPADFISLGEQPSTIDHRGADSREGRLLGGAVTERQEAARAASPITYITGDAPPFLIVHGTADPLVPYAQSELLYDRLMRAGGDVTFGAFPGAEHGGAAFEHAATGELVAAFFDKHLRPRPAGRRVDLPQPAGADVPEVAIQASRAWVNPATAPALTRYCTYESRAARGAAGYALYLPPEYDADPTRRYPVIYWLHGMAGDPRRGGTFVRVLDQAIREGIAPPTIAVLPNGLTNSFYTDSRDGRWPVATALIAELIPHVDATYRTIPDRGQRTIEGQSMGGYGAAYLGFKHPELFGAVSISAGALLTAETFAGRDRGLFRSVFGGDRAYCERESPWRIVEQNAAAIRGRTHVRIFVGDQDRLIEQCAAFQALLQRLDIASDYIVVPGAQHSYDEKIAWMGVQSFDFFARAFGE